MNTALRNVKMTQKGQDAQPLDSLSVRGSTIRYFILVIHTRLVVWPVALLT